MQLRLSHTVGEGFHHDAQLQLTHLSDSPFTQRHHSARVWPKCVFVGLVARTRCDVSHACCNIHSIVPLSPVVTVPGDGSNILEARLNKPSVRHWYCSKSSDWYRLWVTDCTLTVAVAVAVAAAVALALALALALTLTLARTLTLTLTLALSLTRRASSRRATARPLQRGHSRGAVTRARRAALVRDEPLALPRRVHRLAVGRLPARAHRRRQLHGTPSPSPSPSPSPNPRPSPSPTPSPKPKP